MGISANFQFILIAQLCEHYKPGEHPPCTDPSLLSIVLKECKPKAKHTTANSSISIQQQHNSKLQSAGELHFLGRSTEVDVPDSYLLASGTH